jgi:hypothetical protein
MSLVVDDSTLAWAPAVAVSAHIFEEFVFPGGFSAWYRRYRPDAAVSFTPRFAFGINALLVGVCLVIPLQGVGPNGVATWLIVAALLAGNAMFHIRATLRGREYSPGLVTSVAMYLPLAIFGYFHFLRSGRASLGTAVIAAIMGGSYNFISAWLHRRRARRSASVPP